MPVSDDMRAEVLNAHYLAFWESIRHLESQRAQFTTIAISIFTAILSVAAVSGWPERWTMACAAFTALGLLGVIVLAKLFERIGYLLAGMHDIADRLDAVDPRLAVASSIAELNTRQRKERPILSRILYGAVWSWVFRLMFLGGLAGLVWRSGVVRAVIAG